ncbi:hypothetical protein [Streptomyces sp. NPDC058664]|uniref:hypothetical protein n=1 Tax=Streptomyces sp. NPDC058664 TaxID=3346585 RepID=UPI00364C708D
METKSCPRCGSDVLPTTGRGRPRLWCSDECRRMSSEERRAARRTGRPVEIHEEIRDRVIERSRPMSPDGAVERVLSRPASTEKLLRVLAYRMRHDPPITRTQQWMHSRLKPFILELAAAHRAASATESAREPDPAPAEAVSSAPSDRAAAHREAVALVLSSPRSSREVLLGLAEQARQGKLSSGEHSGTITATETLLGALLEAGAIRRRRI